MYYGNIKKFDIADGTGVRVSLFVSGCTLHCKGCFNAATWDFCYGLPYTQETEDSILEMLKPDYIQGLSILGGDPFELQNQGPVNQLICRVRRELPSKDIWMYTGFTYDRDLAPVEGIRHTEYTDSTLDQIDILVDGRFVEELKNLRLNFRGSSNQRIIDMKATRAAREVILSPLNNQV